MKHWPNFISYAIFVKKERITGRVVTLGDWDQSSCEVGTSPDNWVRGGLAEGLSDDDG